MSAATEARIDSTLRENRRRSRVFNGEEPMADIGNSLRIRFGLVNSPSDAQQQQWADLTERLIQQGFTRDQAAGAAARQLFADFGRNVYASEGDTIEFLLRRVKDK
jgi:hypothetical protein